MGYCWGFSFFSDLNMKIILASSSPRRSELLAQMGLSFEVIPSNTKESFSPDGTPEEIALELATQKAKDVASKVEVQALVIGADTIVNKDGLIWGKPKDKEEAYQMLLELSGQVHEVLTGIAVMDTRNHKCLTALEKTLVEIAPLTSEEIKWYIETREPMDKAGAYGIQGLGGILIRRICGCYYNVVGLPIHRLWVMLKQVGVEGLGAPVGN